MSTTRSQKRRNDQQSTSENVSEGLISPIVVGNPCSSNQDDEVAGPSKPKSPRIENSLLENLRASLKEEITSEIKNLLIESQKEMLKLLKPETRGNVRENTEEEVEEETRSFYTPTKSVRISSIQNDPIICRNSLQGTIIIQRHETNGKVQPVVSFFNKSAVSLVPLLARWLSLLSWSRHRRQPATVLEANVTEFIFEQERERLLNQWKSLFGYKRFLSVILEPSNFSSYTNTF